MTGPEVLSIDRLIGRMEQAVKTLEERLPVLANSIESERQARQTECARHWVVTNALSQDMTLEKGARETVIAAAKTARETIAADATTASALAIADAADAAEAKTVLEVAVKAAIAAAAADARTAIAAAALEARTAVKAEAGEHQQQHNWVWERIFQAVPWVVALIAAVGSWLIAKGGT